MEKWKQMSPYILLFCLTIVISCTEARKLQVKINVMQGVHTTRTATSSLNHANGTMMTIEDNRPSSPGHSPGVGHRTFKGRTAEKNL
jgi:hypothetical protein